jgi:hypothetical protein
VRRLLHIAPIAGLIALLLAAGPAHAITFGETIVTADPLAGSGCATPTPKTTFSPSDARVWVWLSFSGAVNGDTVEWHWYDPSDAPYTTATFTITFDGDGCAWGWIDVAGQPAATLPGQWETDVYLSGALATTATFSISAPPPPSGGGAAHLEFFTNEPILVPWGFVQLGYRIKSFQPGVPVDLYVAIVLDGGGPQCIGPELVFASGGPAVASGVPLANLEDAIADGFLPAGFDAIASAIYGVLVAAGTSPGDPANWLSNLAVLDLEMGTLSLEQLLVIAERGNPNAYVIQFFHETAQRVETWLYGSGLGRVVQFVNGRRLAADDDDERAAASVVTPPVFFDPGRFGPTTSPAEIRALLGDPDRVVTSPAGAQTWFFEDSDMSVTVRNGVVRQIEAH